MAKIQAIPQVVNDPMSNLDIGDYLVGIDGVKEETHTDGRLFYQGVFRVVQPASHQGLLHYERFWIGTEEDPEAIQEATWTKNAGRLKKMCEGASVPFLGQNPNVVIQQLQGKQVCIKVIHKQGTKPRDDGSYPMFANIQAYGAPGTMTPHVQATDNGTDPIGAPVTPAPAPAAAPTAPPAPGPANVPAPQTGTPPIPGQGTGMPPQNTSAPAGTPPLPPGTPQYQ